MVWQADSNLLMAGLWDLHSFISFSKSEELRSKLQQVFQDDSDEKLDALLSVIQDKQADEVHRTYAVKTQTIQTKADDETVNQLKYVLLDKDNSLYLRTAVSQTLRYIERKTAVHALIDALISAREPELQTLIAHAIYNQDQLTWQLKTDRLLQTLEQGSFYREHLTLEIILRAILPSGDVLNANRYELTDYLLEKTAVHNSERMIGVIAGLAIESVGRNLNRINKRVNNFQKDKPEESAHLDIILSELNSRLTPAELEARLKQTFNDPLDKTNTRIQEMWEKAISSTQEALKMRMEIGKRLLYGGVIFLVATVIYYAFQRNVSDLLLGILVSLCLLSIAAIYSGRPKQIRQILADIGVANAVYAAYTQRTLEISNSFARRYLQDKLDTADIEKSNELISKAMNDTVKALRDNGSTSLEGFIDQLASS